MAFAKLKTDAFSNPKIRRLSDEGFRAWAYLLTQAWEEAPNKKAGSVTYRGVNAKDEDEALDQVGRLIASAAACDQDTPNVHRVLNELENVSMIHIETLMVGEPVSQDFVVGTGGTAFWDITISLHDWDYHNPRVPPSHTTDGERERKRKYRAELKKRPNGVPIDVSQSSQSRRPKRPTLDQDLDKDQNQDVARRGTKGWWYTLSREQVSDFLQQRQALDPTLTADAPFPAVGTSKPNEVRALIARFCEVRQ